MTPAELRALLASGPLLADGGCGTSLVERGVPLDACFDALNIDAPTMVADVHQAFADAGSRVVWTNTFGATRYNLSRFGLAARVEEVNRAAVELARRASVLVGGSVGPLRVRLAPYGRVRAEDARDAYREQIAALAKGCDFIVVETQSDLVEMEQALLAARDACDVAVVVSATFTRDDRTMLGSSPQVVAQRLTELGADVVGVNCSQGPAQILRLISAIRPHVGDVPLLAKPNAGGAANVGARLLWPATPEYLADHAVSFVRAGASIVGGCCGTSPVHVAAMARALRERTPQADPIVRPVTISSPAHAAPAESPTRLSSLLASRRRIIAVEIDPPKGFSTARLLAGAETLADAGVDVVNVAGSSRARMRMSPWAPCRLIQEHAGLETILAFPTRGRNLLRIQGDLLAAHALGIRNLFVCMGDPMSAGTYPQASDNTDVVPTGLLALVTGALNKGVDDAGEEIGEPTSFVAGCAVNPSAPDLARECRLLVRKIEAGASFALSQAVFSVVTWRRFRDAYERRHGPLTLPVLVGVQPLVTARHAAFLHNEVPGMSIPDETMDRMRRAGEAARDEGRRIAVDLASGLLEEAAGVYVLTPFARFDLLAEIVEELRGARRGW